MQHAVLAQLLQRGIGGAAVAHHEARDGARAGRLEWTVREGDEVTELAADYDHVLTAHTTTGKNFLPRVAAALDVQMISDIIGVESADTFQRPIYAGNAIATVKSTLCVEAWTATTWILT